MTTTKLIEILKRYEFGGATGKPRNVSFCIGSEFLPVPSIVVDSTGDGMFSEICLRITEKNFEKETNV